MLKQLQRYDTAYLTLTIVYLLGKIATRPSELVAIEIAGGGCPARKNEYSTRALCREGK